MSFCIDLGILISNVCLTLLDKRAPLYEVHLLSFKPVGAED